MPRMKETAGRAKDLEDIRQLRLLQGSRGNEFINRLAALNISVVNYSPEELDREIASCSPRAWG